MNSLQYETSPYLLQHAHNPVHWYAWKPEAFERAKAEDKPILVSIGYSTCHWCHVMERESFEKTDVAAFMNRHFINIKVDREERPDVDAVYMEACQIVNGNGGWPLNCFLTPDGKPFYAGTYYPPRPAYNRPSWMQVLEHLANAWATDRVTVEQQAERLLGFIRQNDEVLVEKKKTDVAIGHMPTMDGRFSTMPTTLFNRLRERFDLAEGGFGGAPKFPGTMSLQYLLEYYYHTHQVEALEHVLFSLDKMIHGGIYDQLGGGFARYATDRAWLVPHFEKMLYDNALLVTLLAEVDKVLSDPQCPATQRTERQQRYRETLQETLDYIAREMTHPAGGFYAAQDADSDGVEGKFFVWSKSETDNVLGEHADLFGEFYDVTVAGNWEHTNILHRPYSYETFAQMHGLSVGSLKQQLANARQQLFAVREQRVHPGLDDKILLGWNALMATAYAHAFSATHQEAWRHAAVRNLEFLRENFAQPNTADTAYPVRLYHTWKNGEGQYLAFLEDYAYLIAALVDVYEITFEERHLLWATALTEHVLAQFSDTKSPLFFFTAAEQSDLVLRKKDLYDNATPSGNSTMAHNLRRLGMLLDRSEWRQRATAMLLAMRDSVEQYTFSLARWATAVLPEVYPMYEIAVVGDNAVKKALAIQQGFLPNCVIAASTAENNAWPLLADKPAASDARIYVCRDYACQQPVSTLAEFRQILHHA